MTAQDDTRTPDEIRRENRTLRYQNKQLGKQLGRAGRTIYQLRNLIAALRTAIQVNPGDYQRLLAQLRDANTRAQELQDKLDAAEGVSQ